MSTHHPDPTGFLESTPLVPIEVDALDGRVRYVGHQAGDLLGYPTDVWREEGFWAAKVVPDDQATLEGVRRNTREARGRHEVDYRLECADGRVIWVSELLGYADSDSGPVLRGFLWNVTDRKRQEVALWKSEERLRALLRRAPDAMILTDYEGTVLNMNDQAESLFDYRLSDVVGSNIEHLLPEPLRPRLVRLREAFDRDPERRSLVEGEPFHVQRSDGSQLPVELSLSLVSSGEESRRILWSARDLTVRRRLEAQRRADKPVPRGSTSSGSPPAGGPAEGAAERRPERGAEASAERREGVGAPREGPARAVSEGGAEPPEPCSDPRTEGPTA